MLDETAFRHGSLCVVGNINRDIKTAPLRADPGLFRDGETSVPYVVETIGGGGANSAFAAAALGARVAFLGKVGSDALGRRLDRTLAQHGIAAHLAMDQAQATGTSVALAFESGQRHFVSSLPASRALTLEDVNVSAMKTCQHLLRADIWFSESMLKDGNSRLFQSAREGGMDVSIDLNWDPHWNHASATEIRARKLAVRAALPWVNVAHGNVRELKEFAEEKELEAALHRLLDWGVEAVVVHMGEEGAGYCRRGSWIVEPPAPAKTVVNTTGSGDVLSVCMMLLHRHRAPIVERLRLANRMVAQFIEGRLRLIPMLAD